MARLIKKLDNYLSPKVKAAGFQKKMEEINSGAEKKSLEEQAKFLENEFSVHIKNFPSEKWVGGHPIIPQSSRI